ncbi:MAG TPA: DUF2169 domain-containing protein [Stellaceae bacterium]
MKLINATGMAAGYTLGMEPSGAERLVVAVKGTFTLPARGEEPKLAEEQVPLTDADKFTGEPGLSAVTAECDWAPYKPRCDILLNGSAYAPGGKPAQRVQVGIKVGNWQKLFTVVGDRNWRGGPVPRAGTPEPFEVMPISYDRAFGGVDNFHPDPVQHRTYLPNPVGRGYHRLLEPYLVDNTPLPNTEESNAPVTTPNGDYRPMSFGAIGRNFLARYPLAGTYDQNWQDNVFPFLPADFNPAYFHAAAADQQVEKIAGGEPVILLNLTPDGRRDFLLPRLNMPVIFFRKRGDRVEMQATLDTIVFAPDGGYFEMVWRAGLPLRRDIFEVSQVAVGQISRAWRRALDTGKTYYSSLSVAVEARRFAEAE